MASRPAPLHIDEAVLARHTIAVMPLVHPSDNPATAATANALADKIAAQISARTGLRSVRPPAGDEPAGASSRRSEHVAPYYLSGRLSQRPAQGDIVTDLQAVAVVTGAVIWSGQFQSAVDGDPASLDGIAMAVVNQLRISIEERDAEQITRPGHVPDAAELVILGWHEILQRRSMEEIKRGRDRLRQALQEDPTAVSALTGLAASYMIQRTPRSPLTAQEWAEAERLIERANRLAPSNVTSIQLWGVLQLAKGRADLALPAFDRSIRADPTFTQGHILRAQALLLLGRTDEVQAEIDLALPLGIANRDWPRVSRAYRFAAEAGLMRGEDDRAYELARKALAVRPAEPDPHALMAAIDALAGRNELATTEMATFRKLWPEATVAHFDDYAPSDNPTFLAQRERLYEGLRRAGLPER
jgi:tetratricopeptide (TPR) repeat protein